MVATINSSMKLPLSKIMLIVVLFTISLIVILNITTVSAADSFSGDDIIVYTDYHTLFDANSANGADAVFYAQFQITSAENVNGDTIISKDNSNYEEIQRLFRLPVKIEIAYEMNSLHSAACAAAAERSAAHFEAEIARYQKAASSADKMTTTKSLLAQRDSFYKAYDDQAANAADGLVTLLSIKNPGSDYLDSNNRNLLPFGSIFPKYAQSPTMHHILPLQYNNENNTFITSVSMPNGLDEMLYWNEQRYYQKVSNNTRFMDLFAERGITNVNYEQHPLNLTYPAMRQFHITLPMKALGFQQFFPNTQDATQKPFTLHICLTFDDEGIERIVEFSIEVNASQKGHHSKHNGKLAIQGGKGGDIFPNSGNGSIKAYFKNSYSIKQPDDVVIVGDSDNNAVISSVDVVEEEKEENDVNKQNVVVLNNLKNLIQQQQQQVELSNNNNNNYIEDEENNEFNLLQTNSPSSIAIYDPRSSFIASTSLTCSAYYYTRECSYETKCTGKPTKRKCKQVRTCENIKHTNPSVTISTTQGCTTSQCLFTITGASSFNRDIDPYIECNGFKRYNVYYGKDTADEHFYNDITYDHRLTFKRSFTTTTNDNDVEMPTLRGWLFYTNFEIQYNLVQQKSIALVESRTGTVAYSTDFGLPYDKLPKKPKGFPWWAILLIVLGGVALVILIIVIAIVASKSSRGGGGRSKTIQLL